MTDPRPVEVFSADKLHVEVFQNRDEAGAAAARTVSAVLREYLGKNSRAGVIFAAAPSQLDFYRWLREEDIAWEKIHAFHMDEYLGLKEDACQLFGIYLLEHLFRNVNLAAFERMNPRPESEESECRRYEELLRSAPIAVTCLGVGENGHLAFNDPPGVDFADTAWVKPVTIALESRKQQVNDGCFLRLEDVPKRALTLTVPALLSASHLSVVVPGKRKASAVKLALGDPVTANCPASILRTCSNAVLYLDKDSATFL